MTRSEASAIGTRGPLVHVKVAFEDTLLHGIGHFGLFWHLANRGLHDGYALCTLVNWRLVLHRVDTRHGGALGSVTEIFCEVVAFTCFRKRSRQLVFT